MRYQFQQPGPGRPKGSVNGRRRALAVLDDLLGDELNQEALRVALREHLHKNPVQFFKTIIMPLLPAEARLELTGEGGAVAWQSFLDRAQPDRALNLGLDPVEK